MLGKTGKLRSRSKASIRDKRASTTLNNRMKRSLSSRKKRRSINQIHSKKLSKRPRKAIMTVNGIRFDSTEILRKIDVDKSTIKKKGLFKPWKAAIDKLKSKGKSSGKKIKFK